MKMDAQTRREVFAARSQLRVNQQRRKAGLDFTDERRSGSGSRTLGDKRPNLDQVFFGLVGEAETAGGVNRWRPVWMMRSGSKSRTRPAPRSLTPRWICVRRSSSSRCCSARLCRQSRNASRMTSLLDAYSPVTTAARTASAISGVSVMVRRSMVFINHLISHATDPWRRLWRLLITSWIILPRL